MARDMRFWGWGVDEDAGHGLPPAAEGLLAQELGVAGGVTKPPVALDAVRLPDPQPVRLEGSEVRDDRAARVLHAAGKSYPDLFRQRTGDASVAPDAVVFPRSHEEVLAILAAAEVAIVPFGGGTSVVGGVEPLRGPFDAVAALDLRHLGGVEVDRRSLTATIGAGLRLPEAERALNAQGLTLGHFPQSYEYATVGGCVATRSAGQASTGYGRIDELVLGLTMATPTGAIDLPARPASAAGPDLRELLVGSEGALGVITSASLRVAPLPDERRYEGFFFSSFAAGADAFRILEQSGAAPHVARLSDEDETRVSLLMAGGGWKASALGAYLKARRVAGGSLAICGWEGTADHVDRARKRTVALLKQHGAVPLGSAPGSAWAKGRYHGPYLRDDLMGRGVFVETLETATQWSNLDTLYRAVGDALRSALDRPIVMCHISHLYPSGASLYFTFFARSEEGAELEQWRRAKHAATDAIVAAGGTITHHHAVGADHARWLPAEAGERGVAALRAVKAELDPAGVMNPGKLLAG